MAEAHPLSLDDNAGLDSNDFLHKDLDATAPSGVGNRDYSWKIINAEPYRDAPAAVLELLTRQASVCHEDDRTKPPNLKVIEETGDLFIDPENTVLAHACNCQGKWGAGIAAAFKQRFPGAFQAYVEHCEKNTPNSLIGTALLIAPEEDSIFKERTSGKLVSGPWIACLFTSASHGKQKDTPESILANTHKAVKNLLFLIRHKYYCFNQRNQNHIKAPLVRTLDILAIKMCRINSGLFNVPWSESMAVLESIKVNYGQFFEVIVVSPEDTKSVKAPKRKSVHNGEDGPSSMGPPKREPKRRAL